MTFEIDLNEKIIQEGTKGKVISKDDSQAELIKTALVFAGSIYGYAAGKNDMELLTFADINSSTFNKLRDAEIPLTVEKILDKADALGTSLIPFGITEEKRTSGRAGLNDYLQKFGSVNTGKGSKKSARETNLMLFDKADKKLRVLDKLMLGFKESSPELYSRYNAARVIYDKGSSHKVGDNTAPIPEQQK
ncbi:MAG: hypothetical protein WC879_18460 [Melioribacteraceae bacterium]